MCQESNLEPQLAVRFEEGSLVSFPAWTSTGGLGASCDFLVGGADACGCLKSRVYWRNKSPWLNMNHAEETKELLFKDQGLNEAQPPEAEPQLRRDWKSVKETKSYIRIY